MVGTQEFVSAAVHGSPTVLPDIIQCSTCDIHGAVCIYTAWQSHLKFGLSSEILQDLLPFFLCQSSPLCLWTPHHISDRETFLTSFDIGFPCQAALNIVLHAIAGMASQTDTTHKYGAADWWLRWHFRFLNAKTAAAVRKGQTQTYTAYFWITQDIPHKDLKGLHWCILQHSPGCHICTQGCCLQVLG